jgi:hypothetical protein
MYNHVVSTLRPLFRYIREQSVKVQSFALGLDAFTIDPEGTFLASLLLYNENLKRIILVNNDDCTFKKCANSKITEIVEDS